jgi:hypothetical protein
MTRLIGTMLALALVFGLSGPVRAADAKDAKAILDKAIKALGGAEKLSKIQAVTWKAKGTINLGGTDNDFTSQYAAQGLDHFRQEFEGDFGGNTVKGVTVLAGDKGWRKFGDQGMEMDKDALANQKRSVYLAVIPITILPLKEKPFKVEVIGEDKVGGKTAVGIRAIGSDGKDFKLYFDQASGLPVKLVADVVDFMGNPYTQETTYHDYKEMAGIQKATKIEAKRNGEKFLQQQLTEFKVVDQLDPKLFTEPQ